jgi:hypothetical protein
MGKLVCFALSPNGKFDSAFIELGDGKFTKQPMEQLTFNGADITFNSKIKTQANVFCDQIPFIWRKDQALKDLSDKKKITPEMYNELHTNFDSVLKQLKKDAQILLDEVAQEITRCEEEVKALNYAVLHLELEHEVGRIPDEAYKSASTLLQDNLKRTNTEKTDMETTKSKLSNILLGDKIDQAPKLPKVFSPPPVTSDASELPEPPVVVYVKEIGKAGI